MARGIIRGVVDDGNVLVLSLVCHSGPDVAARLDFRARHLLDKIASADDALPGVAVDFTLTQDGTLDTIAPANRRAR